MWTFIFGAIFLGAILGIIYLASRFGKSFVIRKAAKEKKSLRFLMGFVVVLLILVIMWQTIGAINAAISIIHLMVIWLLCDGISRIVEKRRKKEFERYYAGMAAIGITVVYLLCGWYLAHHVWSTKYVLETDKQVGNLRIVQFADSHVGNTFDGKGFAEQMKAIQSENPDIVVVTGDYVDDDTTKEDMAAACEALGKLETTYGVYYTFGNHDKGYYGSEYRGYSGDDLIAELEKNNVKVLQDETVLLDNRFYLIGRQDRSEDQRGGSRASMKELAAGLDSDKYSIVLDHQPHDYDAQTEAGVDLVLSGHTHGGQLFPFYRMGEWTGIDDKSYGLEKRENTNFIVTSGISDWAIKFKTGCKSEYVVVDVQGKEKTGDTDLQENAEGQEEAVGTDTPEGRIFAAVEATMPEMVKEELGKVVLKVSQDGDEISYLLANAEKQDDVTMRLDFTYKDGRLIQYVSKEYGFVSQMPEDRIGEEQAFGLVQKFAEKFLDKKFRKSDIQRKELPARYEGEEDTYMYFEDIEGAVYLVDYSHNMVIRYEVE